MIRDPFYRKIVEGLEGKLDPELFEQCAADLLRDGHPTLVPIRGGADAGMDGAIADGRGPPFPLVCTTAEDVIGNLTRSLDSYVAAGGAQRAVILATSRALTPRRRRNLERRAKEKGFVLIQTYDQAAIADRLYSNPHWCRELLRLAGNPPALSMVPLSTRPVLGEHLIGRDEDLAWLRTAEKDRLLVDEPGSGKTFLLRELAREDRGLFVVSDDRGEIAEAMRSQGPPAVFIDDAHTKMSLIPSLLQFRAESGLEFSILATCWPGAEAQVTEALQLPANKVRRLERLERDQIIEVVKGCGIVGPIELLRELADQAEGLPGLATTLAYLCLQGDVKTVVSGEALSRSMLVHLEDLIGRRARSILGALSVGGDAGMRMQDVAAALGLPTVDVQRAVVDLAAAGVVAEVGADRLSVRPPALRHALVRDEFFAGAASLPLEPLIAAAPDRGQVAGTLVGARHRGAPIPAQQLEEVLESAGSSDAWAAYAWLGREETRTVLERHPELLLEVAEPALRHAPDLTIPRLLERAVGDTRSLSSTPEHPLRLIDDWVKSALPGTGEAVARRRILCGQVADWAGAGHDPEVALQALCSVLSIGFSRTTTDPGFGNTVTFHQGLLDPEELEAIASLWPDVLETIRATGVPDWRRVLQCVEQWVYPGRIPVPIPDEVYEVFRLRARGMLDDLARLAAGRPGILRRLRKMAEDIGHELGVEIPDDFAVLYPQEDLENWKEAEKRQVAAVRELAREWARRTSGEVVPRLEEVEAEAAAAGITWPRWTPLLCAEIANRVDRPEEWARVAIDAGLAADLVSPFMARAVQVGAPNWVAIAMELLGNPGLRRIGIDVALTEPAAPEELTGAALGVPDGLADAAQFLAHKGRIPEGVLRRLLTHPDPKVAGATAVGVWCGKPKGEVPESIAAEWRTAVVAMDEDEYWLREILPYDPSLARDWLLAHVQRNPFRFMKISPSVRVAVDALSTGDRRDVLRALPEDFRDDQLVAALVGDDLDLFRELLASGRSNRVRLSPLLGRPDESWADKAVVALDSGASPEEIVAASYGTGYSWTGNISDMWKEWVSAFEPLLEHPDRRIRLVAEIGRKRAEDARQRALARERTERVRGLR